MERIRIAKKEWKRCADTGVRLPCAQIANLQTEAHTLRGQLSPANADFERIKQSVDRVMWFCQAVQQWNHNKMREFQELSCDVLRQEMRLKI